MCFWVWQAFVTEWVYTASSGSQSDPAFAYYIFVPTKNLNSNIANIKALKNSSPQINRLNHAD